MHAAAEVALMFDTDGTLVDARRAVVDAVAAGLIATYRHFHLPAPAPDMDRISLAMGLPASAFFPRKPVASPYYLSGTLVGAEVKVK